jgi:pimeloyl-ACP methyl ester carboxylesterase
MPWYMLLFQFQFPGTPSSGWRYERLDGVGHRMQLEAPERISELLLDFLSGS